MRIGTVVVSAPDARYWLTTKSSIDSANETSRLAATAGSSSGISTRPTTCIGGAPRSAAASSTSRPIVDRRPRTMSTTQESVNVTCPIACAVVPRPMKPKAVVNSRNIPTAKTSSGVTSGSSRTMFATPALNALASIMLLVSLLALAFVVYRAMTRGEDQASAVKTLAMDMG